MTNIPTSLNILGIETSCDETAASIVRCETNNTNGYRGTILSNCVHSQLKEHAVFGGVVPEIAARAHVEMLDDIIAQALKEAKLTFTDLDGVAVTAGPGLIGGLLVGMMTAKMICLTHNLPLIGVNHLEGHALTVGLTDNISPPYLLLLVSGGHTQLLTVKDIGDYQRHGTTVDDALGEAFDKTAKLLGLGYPGGPQVEKHATKGDANRFAFPRPMIGRKEPHFSFSGLKTAVRQEAQKCQPLQDQDIADLCASFQTAVVDTVCDRVATALQHYRLVTAQNEPDRLVVAGGVAANKILRQGLEELCNAEDVTLIIPPAHLCTDNAAMIAWAGALRLHRGLNDPLDLGVKARWPLDVDATPMTGAGVKA